MAVTEYTIIGNTFNIDVPGACDLLPAQACKTREIPVTIWAKDSESDSKLYDNVQIEIGVDDKDIWLAFNKSTSAVQMTHAEALEFINQFSEALGEARMLRQQVGEGKS